MKRHSMLKTILLCFGMMLLILDAKTAISGAKEGTELCLRTIIPALFPFFILSPMLTSILTGISIPPLKIIGCPEGTESLYLIGLLGGYPLGAQSIAQSWKDGQLKAEDAHRMLGFCSNAGPAFLFGMAGSLFDRQSVAWMLWIIHILSSVIVALILPGKSKGSVLLSQASNISVSNAMSRAIKSISLVCGWVIIFRVIIAFSQRWFLWFFPSNSQFLYIGLLELSNGCCELIQIPNQGLRFLLCAFFLGTGGLCVAMQTISVTGDLGTGMYFPGKLLQGCISFLAAAFFQHFLFTEANRISVPFSILCITLSITILLIFWLRKSKKSSSIQAYAGV